MSASGVNQSLFEIAVLCTRDQSTSELLQDPLTWPSWMLLSYKHRYDSSQKETNLRDNLLLNRKSNRAQSSRRTRKRSALTLYHFLLEFYTFFEFRVPAGQRCHRRNYLPFTPKFSLACNSMLMCLHHTLED